jgi:signal transduction histidine kinase
MQRALPLDAMDSRLVLQMYAAIVGPVGLFVGLWGSAWVQGSLNGFPYGLDSLTRMVGAVVLAAGLLALGLSRTREPLDRRACLLWFAIAHGAVLAMAALQSLAVWEIDTRRELYWLFAGLGAAFIWLMTGFWRQGGDPEPLGTYLGLFGTKPPSATSVLRSQYERQLRRAGAQEERNRLARDLHDSVKQHLFAIQTAAATAEARLATDPGGTHGALERVREAARNSLTEMDAMLDGLRVAPLENVGLVEAIRHQCDALRLRTGATVALEVGPLPSATLLPAGAHEAVFRMAQEALSNVARHARASVVQIGLTRRGDRLELTVTDDGAGFGPEHEGGMGLRNIRARAAEFDGDAHVSSTPGHGTTVLVSIPFAVENSNYYRNRVAITLGVATFLLGTTVLRWPRGQGSLIIVVPILVDAVRYLVAWRRASLLRRATA